jgi:hypothetical protein
MRWGLALALLLCSLGTARSAEYHIGPDQEFESPFEAPWNLVAGDTVVIHWRSEPYRNKWVVCGQGTADQPITVRGEPGPEGQLPVIDGEKATTPPHVNFWSEGRGVIKIGGANIPACEHPAHIVIENLDIRGGHPDYFYLGREGLVRYPEAAAAIFVERGTHITVRNCILRDSANGFFSAHESSEVLLEGCLIENNGLRDSHYQHQTYTASSGMTYQFNRFGRMAAGAGGNALKDRSAGLVVRYNWIEGGNRQLDLVEADDSEALQQDSRYRRTFVYGNVLIEPDGDGNNQIVHYGGDNGDTPLYRKGVLYLVHNTVISRRGGNTCLVRLSTNGETAVISHNVLVATAEGSRFAILDDAGIARLSRNWIGSGWVPSHEEGFSGRVVASGNLEGVDPGLVDVENGDFRPRTNSPVVDAAAPVTVDGGNVLSIDWEFALPRGARTRPGSGPLDLGALEATAAVTSPAAP